jgi:predicted Zn-ribbon and HTH transcriptional regulator
VNAKSPTTTQAPKAPVRCPNCGSQRIAQGVFHSSGTVIFQPEKLRSFTLTIGGGVSLVQRPTACLDCGLLWSRVSS